MKTHREALWEVFEENFESSMALKMNSGTAMAMGMQREARYGMMSPLEIVERQAGKIGRIYKHRNLVCSSGLDNSGCSALVLALELFRWGCKVSCWMARWKLVVVCCLLTDVLTR